MTPTLGLVCMTQSERVRFKTITRTQLQKSPETQQREVLRALYRHNRERLADGFAFCKEHGIGLFRMSSDLFPFSDTPLGEEVLREFTTELARIGEEAKSAQLRLVMHPDQYVVLSSDHEHVVENARRVLLMHGLIMDLLAQPRSPWASLIIHGGKGDRGPALAKQLKLLPDSVRTRIVLENDERAYSAAEIHGICKESGVPMVFDAHHHVIHEGLASYEDPSVKKWLRQAAKTWPDAAWQLTHISNGREAFGDMRHSDLISVMPSCYRQAPWIEVEAKAKEEAIFQLRQLGW